MNVWVFLLGIIVLSVSSSYVRVYVFLLFGMDRISSFPDIYQSAIQCSMLDIQVRIFMKVIGAKNRENNVEKQEGKR